MSLPLNSSSGFFNLMTLFSLPLLPPSCEVPWTSSKVLCFPPCLDKLCLFCFPQLYITLPCLIVLVLLLLLLCLVQFLRCTDFLLFSMDTTTSLWIWGLPLLRCLDYLLIELDILFSHLGNTSSLTLGFWPQFHQVRELDTSSPSRFTC